MDFIPKVKGLYYTSWGRIKKKKKIFFNYFYFLKNLFLDEAMSTIVINLDYYYTLSFSSNSFL